MNTSNMKTEEAVKTLKEEVVKAIEESLKEGTILSDEKAQKEAILAVLGRAADDPKFFGRLNSDAHETLKEYYHLTTEQRAALASGDIQKIEKWVGKLDERLATWLWCRLSQEQW
jgi:Icc-related predicted phosphoesterase